MGMVRQKLGEILGLSLQAFDGKTTLFPQAVLQNSAGGVLATLDLSHTVNGLYINRSFSMPNNAHTTAVYKVYTDSGHNNLDPAYQEMIDVFVLESESGVLVIDGTLIGIVDDSDVLVGIVDDEQAEFIGVVDDAALIGVLDQDEILVGIVNNDAIIGTISCEEQQCQKHHVPKLCKVPTAT